jgi:hypothetical protein
VGAIRKIAEVFILNVAYIVWRLAIAVGIAIHVWTVIIAYDLTGRTAALITCFLPILAEIYWFIRVWRTSGTILNLYCMVIMGFIVCKAIEIVVMHRFFGRDS